MIRALAAASLVLGACGGGEERRAVNSAGAKMAARIWTDPRVARAINPSGTTVADFKPGADILVQSIPMPLGMATYGVFDQFDMVLFDTSRAPHAQVLDGMRAYCGRWAARRPGAGPRGIVPANGGGSGGCPPPAVLCAQAPTAL